MLAEFIKVLSLKPLINNDYNLAESNNKMKICKTCKYSVKFEGVIDSDFQYTYKCKNINYKRHVLQSQYEAGIKDINLNYIPSYWVGTELVNEKCAFYKGNEPK